MSLITSGTVSVVVLRTTVSHRDEVVMGSDRQSEVRLVYALDHFPAIQDLHCVFRIGSELVPIWLSVPKWSGPVFTGASNSNDNIVRPEKPFPVELV